ncbi:CCR4-NOT transcription complex subunit 6-like-A [Schistosoma japonicum]|nr:CCR4-NOT transcription complex subunit 6-like-A [Schistosoma japonicum]
MFLVLLSGSTSNQIQHMLSGYYVQTIHHEIYLYCLPHQVLSIYIFNYRFYAKTNSYHPFGNYWLVCYQANNFNGTDFTHLYLLITKLSSVFSRYDSLLIRFPVLVIRNQHYGDTDPEIYDFIIHQPSTENICKNSRRQSIITHHFNNYSHLLQKFLVSSNNLSSITWLLTVNAHQIRTFFKELLLYAFVMKKHCLWCLVIKSFMPYVPCISFSKSSLDLDNRNLSICTITSQTAPNILSINTLDMTEPHGSDQSFSPATLRKLAKHRSYALVSAHTHICPLVSKKSYPASSKLESSESLLKVEGMGSRCNRKCLYSDNSANFHIPTSIPSVYWSGSGRNMKNDCAITLGLSPLSNTITSNCLFRFCPYLQYPGANHKSVRQPAYVPSHLDFCDLNTKYGAPVYACCDHASTLQYRDVILSGMKSSNRSDCSNYVNINSHSKPACASDSSIGVFVDLTGQNVSIIVERLPPVENEVNVRSESLINLSHNIEAFTSCNKTCRVSCRKLDESLRNNSRNISNTYHSPCENSYTCIYPWSPYPGYSFVCNHGLFHDGFPYCDQDLSFLACPTNSCFSKKNILGFCRFCHSQRLIPYSEQFTQFRRCPMCKSHVPKHLQSVSDVNICMFNDPTVEFSGMDCHVCDEESYFCNTDKLSELLSKSCICPSLSSAHQWVYIPEPIRLPRNRDVCNALRTCLVPCDQLRNYVHSSPPPRQWRRLAEPNKNGFAFTLMCYNLLSPNYATPVMYPYCPSWALSWDYRRRAILDEIRIYHANIICLQELRTDQFEEVFKPELQKLNYDAVFLPKSRRRTMELKESKKVDGCAIFWQTNKFEKLHEFHHEFMLSCTSMCENPTPIMLSRVMSRDNVAVGVIFETKGPFDGTGGRQFCVTTGHIHWDPEHSDVKVIQTILWTAELWAYIDRFLKTSRSAAKQLSPTLSRSVPLSSKIPVPGPFSPAANMPVILCGDLNSLPESGVVEFLTKGSLSLTHSDFLNYGYKYMFKDWRLLEKWAIDGNTLRHRFTFSRAYQESEGMCLTNFTYDFKGMIDYVLFTRQHFRLLGSLDQICEPWFQEKKILGCPHVHIPSDHFALLVELELMPTPLLTSPCVNSSQSRWTGEIDSYCEDMNTCTINNNKDNYDHSYSNKQESLLPPNGFSLIDTNSANDQSSHDKSRKH